MRRLFIKTAILILFLISVSDILSAQRKTTQESNRYKIAIELKDDVIKLTSQEGCAWKELSLNLKKNEGQVIDQFGIVSKTINNKTQDKNLATFQFFIKRTAQGISIKGSKGPSMKDFSFSSSMTNNSCIILDQNGLSSTQLDVKF